jgi:NAD(P)-dependent dehydrogenase (short-subunit alcohol dehydrogenase family)
MTVRRVLITGASGALGASVAAAFEAKGWELALVDFGKAQPDRKGVIGIGGVDLSDPKAADGAFQKARSSFGDIHAVVNVAGGFSFAKLADSKPEDWAKLFAMNLQSAANMCRAAAPHLPDGSTIINIGAFGALTASAGMGPYAASKAAVHKLTESLAAELKGRVRVNAVLPKTMDTPANRRDMPDVDPKSWTHPDAIAELIVFLASDEGRAVNGALIHATNPAPASKR